MKKPLDLGKDPIRKIFIRYAVPSVLGMLSMSTAQIIDGIFIGRYTGSGGLAAINLAWPLMMVFSGISLMIGTGGATLANIQRGKGERKEADNLYTVTILLLAVFSLVVLVSGLGLLRFIPAILGADKKTEHLVQEYLRIILAFSPLFIFTFTEDLFIRADGSPVISVVLMIAGSLTNMICDYLFIAVAGMGLEGAALATGMSQVIPFAGMAYYLTAKTRWTLIRPVLRTGEIGRMLYNGFSSFIDETSIGASAYVFNLVLMRRIGSAGVAAYSITGYAGDIFGIVFYGIAQAIHSGVSFNKGMGNTRRINSFRNMAMATNFLIGILAMLLLQIFRSEAASVFVKEADIIALASEITFFYSFSVLLSGCNIAAAMFFTAIDKPAESAVISISRSLILLMLGLLLLPRLFGTKGIWLTFAFAETLTFVIALAFFRRTARKSRVNID